MLLLSKSIAQSFIVMSDLHIGTELDGWNEGYLDALMTEIESRDTDFVIGLGDLIDDGYTEDETSLAQLATYNAAISGLTMPVYTLQGNHDSGMSGISTQQVIDIDGIRLICFSGSPLALDPPYDNNGQLSEANLTWIETQLQEAENRKCVLACHYPLSTDIWGHIPPAYGGTDLLNLCTEYNVNVYISGHAHDNTAAGDYVISGVHNFHADGSIFSFTMNFTVYTIYTNGEIKADCHKYISPFYQRKTMTAYL